MDYLAVILLIAGVVLFRVTHGGGIDITSSFGALFIGWRDDSKAWPRGVQEEDRDRPWGVVPDGPAAGHPGGAMILEGGRPVPLMHVRWRVGRR